MAKRPTIRARYHDEQQQLSSTIRIDSVYSIYRYCAARIFALRQPAHSLSVLISQTESRANCFEAMDCMSLSVVTALNYQTIVIHVFMYYNRYTVPDILHSCLGIFRCFHSSQEFRSILHTALQHTLVWQLRRFGFHHQRGCRRRNSHTSGRRRDIGSVKDEATW